MEDTLVVAASSVTFANGAAIRISIVTNIGGADAPRIIVAGAPAGNCFFMLQNISARVLRAAESAYLCQ